MRTNNNKAKSVIVSVYFILIVVTILMATVFSAFSDLTSNPLMTFVLVVAVFLIALFLVHTISRYFEYDSDGLKVIVINKGLLLSDYFNYREHQTEFAKENLISFKINNYIIYRSLVLHIKNSKGHKYKEVFNITLVNRKKRRYIRQSLSKMIKFNRKQKIQIND